MSRGHNVPLPRHRYVFVDAELVLRTSTQRMVPAIWFGLAVHHGRAPMAHVLLENGAIVHDLPWRALAWQEGAEPADPEDLIGWDAYGDVVEVTRFPLLAEMSVDVLDRAHREIVTRGIGTGLALDYLDNGYADHPEQTKVHHIVQLDSGRFGLLPQDRLLWHDSSFTRVQGIPPVLRQSSVDSVEP